MLEGRIPSIRTQCLALEIWVARVWKFIASTWTAIVLLEARWPELSNGQQNPQAGPEGSG